MEFAILIKLQLDLAFFKTAIGPALTKNWLGPAADKLIAQDNLEFATACPPSANGQLRAREELASEKTAAKLRKLILQKCCACHEICT